MARYTQIQPLQYQSQFMPAPIELMGQQLAAKQEKYDLMQQGLAQTKAKILSENETYLQADESSRQLLEQELDENIKEFMHRNDDLSTSQAARDFQSLVTKWDTDPRRRTLEDRAKTAQAMQKKLQDRDKYKMDYNAYNIQRQLQGYVSGGGAYGVDDGGVDFSDARGLQDTDYTLYEDFGEEFEKQIDDVVIQEFGSEGYDKNYFSKQGVTSRERSKQRLNAAIDDNAFLNSLAGENFKNMIAYKYGMTRDEMMSTEEGRKQFMDEYSQFKNSKINERVVSDSKSTIDITSRGFKKLDEQDFDKEKPVDFYTEGLTGKIKVSASEQSAIDNPYEKPFLLDFFDTKRDDIREGSPIKTLLKEIDADIKKYGVEKAIKLARKRKSDFEENSIDFFSTDMFSDKWMKDQSKKFLMSYLDDALAIVRSEQGIGDNRIESYTDDLINRGVIDTNKYNSRESQVEKAREVAESNMDLSMHTYVIPYDVRKLSGEKQSESEIYNLKYLGSSGGAKGSLSPGLMLDGNLRMIDLKTGKKLEGSDREDILESETNKTWRMVGYHGGADMFSSSDDNIGFDKRKSFGGQKMIVNMPNGETREILVEGTDEDKMTTEVISHITSPMNNIFGRDQELKVIDGKETWVEKPKGVVGSGIDKDTPIYTRYDHSNKLYEMIFGDITRRYNDERALYSDYLKLIQQ